MIHRPISSNTKVQTGAGTASSGAHTSARPRWKKMIPSSAASLDRFYTFQESEKTPTTLSVPEARNLRSDAVNLLYEAKSDTGAKQAGGLFVAQLLLEKHEAGNGEEDELRSIMMKGLSGASDDLGDLSQFEQKVSD